jgi:hypothetical protein
MNISLILVLSHIVSITLSFLGFKKKIKFEKFNSLHGGKTNKSRSSLKTGRFSKYFSNLPASLENDLGFIKTVICDRFLSGVDIPPDVFFFAACNFFNLFVVAFRTWQ